MTGENEKFAENNKVLQEQNTVFIENNQKLSNSVKELEEQASKFKEIYQKLLLENEKMARIRDGLQEQLDVRYNFIFGKSIKSGTLHNK